MSVGDATVLVVDDSRTQAEVLRTLLQTRNYTVLLAGDGQEALEILQEQRPRLIISDIVMPVLDGYEMCSRLKAHESWRDIPVILLTQLAEPEDIIRGLHAKADYYLTKPYKPDYLLAKVESLLNHDNVSGARPSRDGLILTLDGREHLIQADRQQMLTLLFSTYENAVEQNRELIQAQRELQDLNRQLTRQMYLLTEARKDLESKQAELLQANQRLEALASQDGLTGLKNHRTFKERLNAEINRSLRYATPLSLILLDVDHFKSFNDTFGHPAGDEVLKAVARILEEGVREADTVARYGGEEFAIILSNTAREVAWFSAERMRRAIQDTTWPHRAITASFGIASLSAEGLTDDLALPRNVTAISNEMIAEADRALYASKARGRNRVTHASALREENEGE